AALAFAREGAAVTIADVEDEAGQRTAEEARSLSGQAFFIHCDVRSMAEIEAAAEATLRAFGQIDVLVNNAARAIQGVVDETDEATWNEVISTNLTSVWRGMKAVVPHMRQRRSGAIVNVSSV